MLIPSSQKMASTTAISKPSIDLSQLESHLWAAANILRGPVDAADFKTHVFPLLFFRRKRLCVYVVVP